MLEQSTIIDNEFMTLWYYPKERIVHHQFHKYMYGQSLRDSLLSGTELVEKHRAKKWLSDDRENSALLPEDKDWCETVWFPRTAMAGWKYWAIVLPRKAIGQMNMKVIIDACAQQGITTQVFDDPDKAMKWLVEVG